MVFKRALRFIFDIPKNLSLFFIKIYQKTLSPDHGLLRIFYPHGCCRFVPTCSQYGYQAIKKYGFFRGWPKAIKRILRCNPFNKGGYDPLK